MDTLASKVQAELGNADNLYYDLDTAHIDLAVKDQYVARHLKRLELSFDMMDGLTPFVVADLGTAGAYHPELKKKFPGAKFHFSGPTEGKWEDHWFDIDLEWAPLPIEDNTVDIVMLFEVIEHFYEDPMYVLAEINRVLKPGGQIFLTTPNIVSAKSIASALLGYTPMIYGKYIKVRGSRRHVHEYTPSTLKLLLDYAGLTGDIWTDNCYHKEMSHTLAFLEEHGFPINDRGDTIFGSCIKTGPVKERFPAGFYD